MTSPRPLSRKAIFHNPPEMFITAFLYRIIGNNEIQCIKNMSHIAVEQLTSFVSCSTFHFFRMPPQLVSVPTSQFLTHL